MGVIFSKLITLFLIVDPVFIGDCDGYAYSISCERNNMVTLIIMMFMIRLE